MFKTKTNEKLRKIEKETVKITAYVQLYKAKLHQGKEAFSVWIIKGKLA